MIATSPSYRPCSTVLQQRIAKAMNVLLHVGAHRCATTSFQHYLRQNAAVLGQQGIGFWGPLRTRKGLFSGILNPSVGNMGAAKSARRAMGRVQLNLIHARDKGVRTLIVSDENMIGSVRQNLRLGELYCGIGERMARFNQAFDGRVSQVVLSVRSLDLFWASSMGYAVARGRQVPSRAELRRLTRNTRSWRDVITDLACAMPGARIRVLPFERFAGRPDKQLSLMSDIQTPSHCSCAWRNATPRLRDLRQRLPQAQAALLPRGEGRWMPFDPAQRAEMRSRYEDDMAWLAAGADGLAVLATEPQEHWAGRHLPRTELTRGRSYDEERRLAGAG